MSIKRGGFVLVCQRCGEQVDLDTDDFDKAKENAKEHKEQNNWTTVVRGDRYVDLCGGCA